MAAKYKAGMQYGRLTLISRDAGSTNKHPRWSMSCDCGSIKIIDLYAVVSGRQSSCGCYRLEQVAQARRLQLTGRRIGKLVVRRFYTSLEGETFWLCECDCGCGYIGRGTHLSRARVTSCGCVSRAYIDAPKTAEQLYKYAQNHIRRSTLKGCSGSFTSMDVQRIYRSQKGRCPWCKTSLKGGFHRDHKFPLALGGTNNAENIELLCPKCNIRKHAKDPIDWANENGKLL